MACTKRRAGGCGKSTRFSLFLSALRSTVTRQVLLVRAAMFTLSIYGTTVPLVPCSNHPHDIISSRSRCSCRTTSSQNAMYMRTRPGAKALPPAPASHARGLPRQPPGRALHRVPKHVCLKRKCERGVENRPCVHPTRVRPRKTVESSLE